MELNRAVAVAMADGPEAGLTILDGIGGWTATTCCMRLEPACFVGWAGNRRRPFPTGGRLPSSVPTPSASFLQEKLASLESDQ